MNFHLQFPITPFEEKINYRQSFLFMGSCFAENIGEVMERYKFNVLINPSGIIYNPASIALSLRQYCFDNSIKESDLFYANEVWNSWAHHSEHSKVDKQETLNNINFNIHNANSKLLNADWLFITFGSAYYYRKVDTGQVVANCHKQPQKLFTKHLLTTDEIVNDYLLLFNQLQEVNPNLKIVITVSPVRYVRDGIIENNRSKARLIEAAHQLKEQRNNVFYFPAYEIIIDDLRDYRFYKEDLTHPNKLAIDYVFEKWMETAFDAETKGIFERIKSIITDYNHRPLHPETDAHKKFVKDCSMRVEKMKREFPFINLDGFS